MTPMGLLGSPASFGRMMDFIMRFLSVITYQDDILVHSQTHEHHLDELQKVFDRLRAHGLKLNVKKCFFAQTEVAYLGFTLTPNGILPGKDKSAAIKDFKPPATVRQVREFVGLCNYFRQSVQNFSELSRPLTALTQKACTWKGGDLPPLALVAFEGLKQALVNPPVLAYPNPELDYHLMVDASIGSVGIPGGVGAALIQIDKEDVPHAIGYASRGLSKFEKNYTAYLLELQAACFGITHFNVYLRGRHFTLHTDHCPLETLSKVHVRTLNRLQQ
jgi:putative transposase